MARIIEMDEVKKGVVMLRIVLVSIGASIFSSSAFADSSVIKASNNQISIQTISTNVDYTETGGAGGTVPGKLDTETGDVHGYSVNLSVMSGEDNKYFAASYGRVNGRTTYTGASIAPGSVFGSVYSTSTAVLTDYFIRLGSGFSFDTEEVQSMLTPYFEVGNHRWERGLGGGAPYHESYTNDYLGIGVIGQYSPPRSKLVLSANGLMGSTFRSNISVSNGVNSWEGSLVSSAITKCSFSADYEMINHLHGNLSVDFVSFSYGASGGYTVPAGGYFEPDSKTNYTTIKLGLGYAF